MKCALIAFVKKLRIVTPSYLAVNRLQQRIIFVQKERVIFGAHGHQLHAITCRRFCVVLSVKARKHQQVVVFHSFFNSATVNVGEVATANPDCKCTVRKCNVQNATLRVRMERAHKALVKSPHFCGPLLQSIGVCVKISRRENTDFRFWPIPQAFRPCCVDANKFDFVHIFAPLKNKDRPACADCDLITSPFLVLKVIYNYNLRKTSTVKEVKQ